MAGVNAERSMWNHLMDVMERLEKVEAQSRADRLRDAEEIKGLKAKVAEQEETIRKLQEEISRLKHKDDTDSHNSSLPPSTDQRPTKAPNEYNGRKETGRKSGGQKGHPGTTRRLQETKEQLRELGIEPVIEEIGDTSKQYRERLVLDILLTAKATIKRFHEGEDGKYHIPEEYHSEVVYGENVKAFVILLYGQGVQSVERIVEMVAAMSGQMIRLSQGTVYEWLEEFHREVVAKEQPVIESKLLDHDVVSTDGTVTTVNGQQTSIRNFSVPGWVLYAPMDRKNIATLQGIPFLAKFTGTLVHDHETALYHFGTNHAECNVHLIRHLTANTENTGHQWCSKMISLLTEMNQYRKRLVDQGMNAIPEKTLQRLEKRYDELLDLAKQERKNGCCRLRWALKEETSLMNRMKKYKRNHLLFLHDFAVPFDNNMSERDLRKCKNRQKMAGGFRTAHGKEIFCSVLSITETCKRQSINLIHAFRTIFSHKPLFTLPSQG